MIAPPLAFLSKALSFVSRFPQAVDGFNDYRYGALDFFLCGGLSHAEADGATSPIVRDAHGLEHVGNRDGVGVAGRTRRCGDVIADGGQQPVGGNPFEG